MTISPSISDASTSGGNTALPDDRPLTAPKTASLATAPNDISPGHLEEQNQPLSSNDIWSGHLEVPIPTMEDSSTSEASVRGDVQEKISKLLKGKEEEWTAVANKKGPLQLLDLPMDLLKEIIKEVLFS